MVLPPPLLMWAIYAVSIVGSRAPFWDIDKERLAADDLQLDMLVRTTGTTGILPRRTAGAIQAVLVASPGDRFCNPRPWPVSSSSSFRTPRERRLSYRLPEMPRCRCETPVWCSL